MFGLDFYIYISLSAGVGTAFVEILLKLFLSDWLNRRFYKFKLNLSDKRACADQILDLIKPENYQKWQDLSSPIYSKAYELSDRLETIKDCETSKILDKFVSEQRMSKTFLDKLFENPQDNKISRDFLNSQWNIDELRKKLVNSASKLR